MSTTARHAIVSGRVQGVGFRWHARDRAAALGLKGWVCNLPDGRVETFAEGDSAAVESFLDWLSHGPPAAQVTGVDVAPAQPSGASAFEIRRAAR
jgi:acylphosphatase